MIRPKSPLTSIFAPGAAAALTLAGGMFGVSDAHGQFFKRETDKAIAAFEAPEFVRSTDYETAYTVLKKANAPYALIMGENILTARSLERYAQDIVDRLYAAYTGPKPNVPIQVKIVADPLGGARAGFDGVIYVGTGLFELSGSEDEVAFILAHELAHVIAEDFKLDAFTQGTEQGADRLALMGTAGAAVANVRFKTDANNNVQSYKASQTAETKAARTAAMGYLAASEIAGTLVGPRYKRPQENRADKIAIDLMIRAGYNHMAVADLFDRVVERRKTAQDRFDELTTGVGERIAQTVLSSVSFDGYQITFNTEGAKKRLQRYGRELLVSGAFQMRDGMRMAKHERAEKRFANLVTYVEKFYADADLEDYETKAFTRTARSTENTDLYARISKAEAAKIALLKGNIDDAVRHSKGMLRGTTSKDAYIRYTMYAVRRAEYDQLGRQEAMGFAILNLERALGSGTTTPHIYTALANEYATQGKMRRARDTIKSAETRFGQTLPFLPVRISIEAASGDSEKVAALMQTCTLEGTRKIRQLCETAMQTGDPKQVTDQAGTQDLTPSAKASPTGQGAAAKVDDVRKNLGKWISGDKSD